MFETEKYTKWRESVERKITIGKNNPTTQSEPLKPSEENDAKLKFLMDREENGKSKVCIQYTTQTSDTEKNQFVLMNLKWYTTHLVLEKSLVKRKEDKPDEELSYNATIYTKFSGIRTEDSDDKTNNLILLYGSDKEEKLPILIDKKDVRKLFELICDLG